MGIQVCLEDVSTAPMAHTAIFQPTTLVTLSFDSAPKSITILLLALAILKRGRCRRVVRAFDVVLNPTVKNAQLNEFLNISDMPEEVLAKLAEMTIAFGP